MTQALSDPEIINRLKGRKEQPEESLPQDSIVNRLKRRRPSSLDVPNQPSSFQLGFREPDLERGAGGELFAALGSDVVTLAKSARVLKNSFSILMGNTLSSTLGVDAGNLSLTDSTRVFDEMLASETLRASESVAGTKPQLTNPVWWSRIVGSNTATFALQLAGTKLFRPGGKTLAWAGPSMVKVGGLSMAQADADLRRIAPDMSPATRTFAAQLKGLADMSITFITNKYSLEAMGKFAAPAEGLLRSATIIQLAHAAKRGGIGFVSEGLQEMVEGTGQEFNDAMLDFLASDRKKDFKSFTDALGDSFGRHGSFMDRRITEFASGVLGSVAPFSLDFAQTRTKLESARTVAKGVAQSLPPKLRQQYDDALAEKLEDPKVSKATKTNIRMIRQAIRDAPETVSPGENFFQETDEVVTEDNSNILPNEFGEEQFSSLMEKIENAFFDLETRTNEINDRILEAKSRVSDVEKLGSHFDAENAAAELSQEITNLQNKKRISNAKIGSIHRTIDKRIQDSDLNEKAKTDLLERNRSATESDVRKRLDRFQNEIHRELTSKARARLAKNIKEISDLRRFSEGIRGVMESIGVEMRATQPNDQTVERLTSLRKFLEQNPQAILPLGVENAIEALGKSSPKDLDRKNADLLSDLIEEGIARSGDQLQLKIDQKIVKGEVVVRLVDGEIDGDSARDSGLPLTKKAATSRTGRVILPGAISKVIDWIGGRIQNWDSELISEFVTGKRKSVTSKIIHDNIDDGQAEAYRAWDQTHDLVSDAFAKLFGNSPDAFNLSEELAPQAFEAMSLGLIPFGESTAKTETFQLGKIRKPKRTTPTPQPAVEQPTEVAARTSGEAVAEPDTFAQTVKWTPMQKLGVVLLMVDPDRADKILVQGEKFHIKGQPLEEEFLYKMDQNDFNRLLNSLSQAERDYVTFVAKDINGRLKKLMKAYSFKAHSRDITRPGLYSPSSRVWESKMINQMDEKNYFQASALLSGVARDFNTSRLPSVTKERARGAVDNAFEVDDILITHSNHAWTVGSLAYVSEPLRAAISLMNNPGIAKKFRRFKNGRINNRLEGVFKQLAAESVGGSVHTTGPLQAVFNSRMMVNIVTSLLANSPKIAAYQAGSFLSASTEIDMKWLIESLRDLNMKNTDIDAEWKQWSPQIYHRTNFGAAGLVNSGGIGKLGIAGFKSRQDRNMVWIRGVDSATVRVIWGAHKLEAMSRGLEGDVLMAEVAKKAWHNVNKTQPTQDPLHLSGLAIEARQTPMVKPTTIFRSQRAKQISILMTQYMRMARDPTYTARGAQNIAVGVIGQGMSIVGMKWLWRLMLIGAATGTASLLSKGTLEGLRFRKEDEDAEKLTRKVISDILMGQASIFNQGELLISPLGGWLRGSRPFDIDISPLASIVQNTIMSAYDLGAVALSDEPHKLGRFVDEASDLMINAAIFSGIPLVSPARETKNFTKEFLEEMNEGSAGISF